MKKTLIVLLSSIVVGLALNVQAASITFGSRVVEFKVTPGEIGRTTLMVHGFSSGPYSLNFRVGSRLENSNIPPGWLSPVYLNLTSRIGGASSTSMDLVVNLPPDAMVGSYTGLLVPEDMRSSEPISSPGVIIAIEVTDPQTICSGIPIISDVEIGPQSIWAPADKDVEITITGVLRVTDGCDVTAGYTLESNNGLVQGDITLKPDGSFSERFMANVSRSGRDKEGRVYNGTLFAVDADGNEAQIDFSVTVLHDKGKKTGKIK